MGTITASGAVLVLMLLVALDIGVAIAIGMRHYSDYQLAKQCSQAPSLPPWLSGLVEGSLNYIVRVDVMRVLSDDHGEEGLGAREVAERIWGWQEVDAEKLWDTQWHLGALVKNGYALVIEDEVDPRWSATDYGREQWTKFDQANFLAKAQAWLSTEPTAE